MKKISGRTIVTTLLSLMVMVMLGLFLAQYLIFADTWVSYPGSPHIYAGGNITTGQVVDRNGELLLSNGSSRMYSEDEMTRMSTLHLLGDRYGYIEAPLINTYAEKMLDYNRVTGLYESATEGSTIALTLSTEACNTALYELGYRKGTVGVYNYKTGEILCMVSSGTYDPDEMPSQEDIEAYDYYEGVFVNRFTDSAFVPGSIFKIVTASAAIDNIPDVFSKSFYCEQEHIIAGEYVNCQNYHGNIDFGNGLVKSCNHVFGSLAVELGANTLTQYARAAGITDSVAFDGTRTEPGNFDLTGASDADLAWAGVGQYTTLVNPCQFMTYLGSIANGGVAAKPYVVSSVKNGDGEQTYQAETELLDATMKASTADTLVSMMRDDVVYNYGTYHFPDVYVCAKSGTAEVDGETPNAMFAGFVQDENYPLAFIVVVENAGSGSEVCVSIAGNVLEACINDMKE